MTKSNIGCISVFLAVWLSGWTAGTLVFDYLCVTGTYTQFQSQTYPSVTGAITKSKVVTTHDSEGDHRRAKIQYEYWVGDKQFSGDQLRFGMNLNQGSAEKTVKKYEKGSEHTVYYQPDDPVVAALSKGILPSDFFFPMFLVPFNMIMLGGWTAIGSYLYGRISPQPASIKVRNLGRETLYQVYEARPIYVVLASAGVAGFAAMFVIGIPLMMFQSWLLVGVGWTLIAAVTLLGWWRTKPCLVEVDALQETVTVTTDQIEQWQRTEIESITAKHSLSKSRKKHDTVTITGSADRATAIICSSTDAAKWLSDQIRDDLRIS